MIDFIELNIKIEIYEKFGEDVFDNIIYYNHTNSICFNWRSYGKRIEQAEADKIMSELSFKLKYEVK